jgi:hypothetical protein
MLVSLALNTIEPPFLTNLLLLDCLSVFIVNLRADFALIELVLLTAAYLSCKGILKDTATIHEQPDAEHSARSGVL